MQKPEITLAGLVTSVDEGVFNTRILKQTLSEISKQPITYERSEILRNIILQAFNQFETAKTPDDLLSLCGKLYSTLIKTPGRLLSLIEVLGFGGHEKFACILLQHLKAQESKLGAKHLTRFQTLKPQIFHLHNHDHIDIDRTLLSSLQVFNCEFKLNRYGSNFDGGYILCELPYSYDLFLSGGVSTNCDFESHCCEAFRIECLAFDSFITTLPAADSKIIFSKNAAGSSISSETVDFSEYLSACKRALIKIDIDGNEYKWLQFVLSKYFNNVLQLVVEFHLPYTEHRLALINTILNTHKLVHVHANNLYGCITSAWGSLPRVITCTFVNNSILSSCSPRTEPLPCDIDAGNSNLRPQICLDKFPFILS